MSDPVVSVALRLGLCLLLGSAALHKLRDPARFRETLGDYRLLPEAWVAGLAGSVVVVELGLAAGLLVPSVAPAAAVGCAALLALYSGAIAVNLGRGRRHIDCGCTGPAQQQTLSGWLLVRNAVLIAAASAAAFPFPQRPWVWLDTLTLVATLLGSSLLWLASTRLMTEWPELRRLRRSS
jgi:uncharacterized membrane protein YphA (DoxX/SURF4 family)